MKIKCPRLPSSVSTRKIDGRRIPRKVSFSVVVTPLLDISFVSNQFLSNDFYVLSGINRNATVLPYENVQNYFVHLCATTDDDEMVLLPFRRGSLYRMGEKQIICLNLATYGGGRTFDLLLLFGRSNDRGRFTLCFVT